MHPFDTLSLKNGTKLIFTPCPGTKDATLEDSIMTLKVLGGATAIITLMPDAEMTKFNATALPKICTQNDIQWFHLPVEDDEAPEQPFIDAFALVKKELMSLLEQQATIAIHCRGGSGRTGLMAAILMLETAQSWQEIERDIQALRPRSLKIPAHVEYLEQNYQISS